ncbi:hypothetical protein HWV62_45643 [Athelia sp. TMB]|nr:hypothetical protein HWV62_45643 [Athelia sp. TMB]
MDSIDTKRKYTSEEKKQLLENLDIEVEHKVRQFEAWLSDALENFRIYQEGQISRVPKLVRGLTMREFGEKYNGDVQAALRGVQRERMGMDADSGAGDIEIDKSTRKRKWVASMEEQQLAEGSKAAKNGEYIANDWIINLMGLQLEWELYRQRKNQGPQQVQGLPSVRVSLQPAGRQAQ